MAFLYAKIVREYSKSLKVVSYLNKVVPGASSAGDIDRLTKKRVIADAKEAQVQVPHNKFVVSVWDNIGGSHKERKAPRAGHGATRKWNETCNAFTYYAFKDRKCFSINLRGIIKNGTTLKKKMG